MRFSTVLAALVLLPFILLRAQEYQVAVRLLDGATVEGTLLRITTAGVDINPGGAVKMRYISADRIKSVHVPALDALIYFPLDVKLLPPELQEFKNTYRVRGAAGGFTDFLLKGGYGYASTGNSDYYKGFHDGPMYAAGAHYFFSESVPAEPRTFIGFTFNELTTKGDQFFDTQPELTLREYSFEIGRTTAFYDETHFFHLLMGVVIIENEIKLSNADLYGTSYQQNKAGIRAEAGISIRLNEHLLLQVSAGTDVIIESGYGYDSGYRNTAYEERTFNGWIPKLLVGLAYGF